MRLFLVLTLATLSTCGLTAQVRPAAPAKSTASTRVQPGDKAVVPMAQRRKEVRLSRKELREKRRNLRLAKARLKRDRMIRKVKRLERRAARRNRRR